MKRRERGETGEGGESDGGASLGPLLHQVPKGMAPIDPLCRWTSGVDVSAARDAVTRLAVIARKNAGRYVRGRGECTVRGIRGTVSKEAMQSILTGLGLRDEASSCYHCDSSQ